MSIQVFSQFVRPFKGLRMKLLLAMSALAAAGAAPAAEAVQTTQAPVYIGGAAPDQRRGDVPVIKEAPPLDKKAAFHGIQEPYPESLKVFDSQGAWYTPFTRAGMTGRYDIRGYHHPE